MHYSQVDADYMIIIFHWNRYPKANRLTNIDWRIKKETDSVGSPARRIQCHQTLRFS